MFCINLRKKFSFRFLRGAVVSSTRIEKQWIL
jgi:hypothetical protein